MSLILSVRISILASLISLCSVTVGGQQEPLYREAERFAKSDTMLNSKSNEGVSRFAAAYAEKCKGKVPLNRLDQWFYDHAYKFAYDAHMLDESREDAIDFVWRFALSCNSKQLITEDSYEQAHKFAFDSYILDYQPEDASLFVKNYVLNCGKVNYLTPGNFEKVHEYALASWGLNMRTDPQALDYTRTFFSQCREICFPK